MPAKLSEAFRLNITGGGNIGPSPFDPVGGWAYSASQRVGSNASSGAMNYQSLPPMGVAPPYHGAGAGQHVPATGWLASTGGSAMPDDWSNTLLFISLGIFFLLLLDMVAKRAAG